MKKLLFVSHNASRTGAPIVLLTFLNWLKLQGSYQAFVYLKQDGELLSEFESVAKTYLPLRRTVTQRITKRLLKRREDISDEVPAELLSQRFDLIYLNTVVCLDLAPLFKKNFKCPVICHIHENQFTINYYYPEVVSKENLQAVDRFIAVSKSTAFNISTIYRISANAISLVYEFVDLKKINMPVISKEEARHQLRLTNEFIVGGSGLTSWRKGIDMFVRLAIELEQLRPDNNIKLVWVGHLTHEFKSQFAYELQRLGLLKKIILSGSVTNPQNYFQIFDVFALTSREDPFPLVAIEAASLSKPILCFEASGGIEELIENEQTGFIIPYADVKGMALKVLALYDNQSGRLDMGKKLSKVIAAYDVNVAAPKILRVIEDVLIQR